ncbi:hypothetical protein DPX16_0354 [Anabarilius grahami]|uniref:Uncharacterized protein n=1 Tax=Anabarilius grahami TaxID=495550 RepID=A0A3N0Y548_ANAGA|nr:hypothetical protein DPX16_0354 [Anabarilius grahami]
MFTCDHGSVQSSSRIYVGANSSRVFAFANTAAPLCRGAETNECSEVSNFATTSPSNTKNQPESPPAPPVLGPTWANCCLEPWIIGDVCAAQQPNILTGLVEEPCFLILKEEDQEQALLQLSQAETDDDTQLAKEPLVFHFKIKNDMDISLNECLDKNSLVINRMFMEI